MIFILFYQYLYNNLPLIYFLSLVVLLLPVALIKTINIHSYRMHTQAKSHFRSPNPAAALRIRNIPIPCTHCTCHDPTYPPSLHEYKTTGWNLSLSAHALNLQECQEFIHHHLWGTSCPIKYTGFQMFFNNTEVVWFSTHTEWYRW